MDNHQPSMRHRPAGVGAAARPERDPADYLFHRNDIPLEVKAFALARLGNDAQVHPARRNGSYKGTILLNSRDWLVQALGRHMKTAVAHRKTDVMLVGSVKWRDENRRLGGAAVQVHYNGSSGKAYPLQSEQSRPRPARSSEPTRGSTGIER